MAKAARRGLLEDKFGLKKGLGRGHLAALGPGNAIFHEAINRIG